MVWIPIRSALAAVFAVSSAAKFADRAGTRSAVAGFGIPERFVSPVALALPIAEAAASVALVPSTTARYGAVLALALLVAFTAAIGLNLAQGRTPDCNCFGQIHSTPVGPSTIVRNLVLASAAGVVAFAAGSDAGGSMVADGGRVLAAIASAATVVAALVLLPGGKRALSIGSVESQPEGDGTPGPAVGTVPPAFALEDLRGATITLDELIARGAPVLLTFVSPTCGPCTRIAPVLAHWQQTFPGRVTVAVLSSGTPELARSHAERFGIAEVLLDSQREVDKAYALVSSPSAILIGTDGMVAAPGARGEVEIRNLLLEAFGIRTLVESLRGDESEPPARRQEGELIDPDTIDGSFVAVPRDGVALGEAVGQSVLFDRWTWAIHLLNPAAAVVWQCLDGAGSLDEIAADIADVLAVPSADARAAVIEATRGFGREGLLRGVGPAEVSEPEDPESTHSHAHG